MAIPSGPLAYTSRAEAVPLSEVERSILMAAGTGATGWSMGVPFGPDRPDEHAHYTQRFTGRAAPTAAGIGTPVLFTTDDSGTYLTNTRDTPPPEPESGTRDGKDMATIVAATRACTVKLSDGRLDLPAAPPHMLGLTNRMERLESYADIRTIQSSLERGTGSASRTSAERIP